MAYEIKTFADFNVGDKKLVHKDNNRDRCNTVCRNQR